MGDKFCGNNGIDSRLYEIIGILESIPAVPDEVIEKLRVIQDDIPCDCEEEE